MPETLFYDGRCSLCHGFVRFTVQRDRTGRFEFAPLGGERFRELVAEDEREKLPESLVLRTADGRLLVRSQAVLAVLAGLGGYWRVVAAAGHVVPAVLRDRVYDLIARIRYRVFGRRAEACPIVLPDLRRRFRD